MSSGVPGTPPRLVSFGEALTDMVRVEGTTWQAQPGGAGWNVARAAAALRLPSAFAGTISQDCFGDAIWHASTQSQLDVRFLQRVNKPPLLAIVHETHPPQYFFVGTDSADLSFDPALLPTGWDIDLPWAHFGGISLAREPLASCLLALARHLKTRGTRISYDPNYRNAMTPGYRTMLAAMVALADVVKVSDEDLQGLLPEMSTAQALAALHQWNPTARVLHTHGSAGATLWHEGVAVHCPAFAVEVVDTVGAGDASIAGLICSLMESEHADNAQHLRWSSACGAAACLARGPSPPSRVQVARLVQAE